MKTNFTASQLADPKIAEADKILQTCQHFGFCTSGCPTYVLLHDENDGPRGRIDLIKEMLESDEPPKAKTVEHIDKCLSCMSCVTTCAVKVDYMHLVDTARAHIQTHYKRPLAQRVVRQALGFVLPRSALFKLAMAAGRASKPFTALMPQSLRHIMKLVPDREKSHAESLPVQTVYPAHEERRWRVALLAGCVQPVLSPHINDATIRLLTRHGCEVVIPASAGCCGSLNLHMGNVDAARVFARANVAAWAREIDAGQLDAILVNASGCGTTVKDYPHLLHGDAEEANAKRVGALAMDITQWLKRMDLRPPPAPRRLRVAYHDACSLRNAQKVTSQPRSLLRAAGFSVQDVPESHFCCGSAGTYNMLQPELARQLGERKAQNIASTEPQIVCAGNIGCITQIGMYSQTPIVHTVELLDWAYGGPKPMALASVELVEAAAEPDPPPVEQPVAGEHALNYVKKAEIENQDVGFW